MIENRNVKSFYQIIAALFGCFALVLQLYLIIKRVPVTGKTYSSEIIRYFSYMTIWTNILVTITFAIPLIAKNSRFARFLSSSLMQTGTMLFITIVGLVYHFLLADIWSPTGLQKVADVSLHYIVPGLYIIYWIFFVKKGGQYYINSIKWMLYPLVYCIYALIRGTIVHEYPYPFIDVSVHGYAFVLRNSLLLAAGYLLGGLVLILIDKGMAKSFSNITYKNPEV